jgi:hypothetical protein
MRIACCTSALILAVLVAACGSPPPREPPPATGSAPTRATTTPAVVGPTSRIELPTARGAIAFDVETDDTVAAGTAPNHVDVIGELSERAIIIADRYPSIPGGLSMCQAGEESFVRVVSVASTPPRVTFTAKIGSCLQNIELAEPGLEWRAETATLRIEWLANAAGTPETQELVISPDGRVLIK